ncbi:MAG: hypothetical protein M1608_00880 [Candidatus Omnitrophica bacterium]|nr:hypothetical protein [Candidatus Omnitrophota bacterium]
MVAHWFCLWKNLLLPVMLGSIVLSAAPPPAPSQSPALPLFLLWDKTINLRAGFGYKDNVLLSHQNAKASPFVASGLDVMVFRLPTSGTQFYWFLTGDDLRYLCSPGVDKEDTLISQAELKKEFSHTWQGALDLQYLYQNQVFDASLTEAEFFTVKAQGHRLTLYPWVQHTIGQSNRVELQWNVSRQFFDEPLDSYWEVGPRIAVGRSYGYQSDLALSYEILDRPYDHRRQAEPDGTSIPNESLSFLQQEVAIALQHSWDPARHWRTLTKLSYLNNADNGSGYYDFDRFQLSQRLSYRVRDWVISAQVRLSQYNFDIQPISDTDTSHRQKTYLSFTIHGEVKIIESLKWYADFEYENSLSNLAFDEYQANTISSGVDWEF